MPRSVLPQLKMEKAFFPLDSGANHYKHIRLNTAFGYITPKDMLALHQQEIQADRDRELQAFNTTVFVGTNPMDEPITEDY